MNSAKPSSAGYTIMQSEDAEGGVLVLKNGGDAAVAELLARENVSMLRLSEDAGWKGRDISWVGCLDRLTGIEVYSSRVRDVSPIQRLCRLHILGLDCPARGPLNFHAFPELTVCKITLWPGAHSVFGLEHLKYLNVSRYPDISLTAVSCLRALERLKVFSSKLISAEGCQALNVLRKLTFAYCHRLTDLEALGKMRSLESLELASCGRIKQLDWVSNLTRLVSLWLDGCGSVGSLAALGNLQCLQQISFCGSTVVREGDMSVLLSLPRLRKVFFVNRRHYSHTRAEIQRVLDERCGCASL